MARLFIAVGSPDTKASSPVFPVYVGRDGDAMQKAMEASPHLVHQIFRGPLGGIFKHNARAAVNAAALAAATETPAPAPVAEAAPAVEAAKPAARRR